MTRKIKIMVRAAKIRMARGEDIDAILSSWPNLTEEERRMIRKEACNER